MSLFESLRRLKFRAQLALRSGSDGQRDYWKSVATLTTGSFASQAIGIASILATTRLYTPVEFGSYALFFASAGLLSLLATAKFDAAVFTARSSSEAGDLAMLGILISLLVGIAILLLSPLLDFLFVSVTHRPMLFLMLLAFATASGGATAAMTAWAMQLNAFGVVTKGRMAQAIVTAALAIGFGLAHWDATGLIVALIAGQLTICAVIAWHHSFVGHARCFTWRRAKTRARRNARFPQYLLVGEGLNYFGNNAVAFVTPGLFGAAALGQFNLGQRVAAIPINIIGTSMGGVFRTMVSPQHAATTNVPQLFRSSLLRLSVIGALLTLPLLVAGPLLFRVAFGPQWEEAGFYVQLLSPLIFVRFVVSPLSVLLLLANRQRLDTVLQGLFVLAAFVAVGIGAWAGSFVEMVVALTTLQVAIYGLYLVVSYRLANGMVRA